MAEYVADEFDYVDNGMVIRKKVWHDPDSGATWETFDNVGPASDANMASGTVVNRGTLDAFGQPTNRTPQERADQLAQNPQADRPPVSTPTAQQDGRTVSAGAGPQNTSTTYADPSGSSAPAAAGGSVSTNPFNPGGSVDPSVVNQQRNMFLYNPDQPGSAMANVMRGMGFKMGLNNPLTNMLMRFAPGLGAAFSIGNAMGGNQQLSPDMGGDFGSFINKNLTGGGLSNTLMGARNQLPDAIARIRADALAAGGVGPVNPYLANLQQTLEAQGGQGLAAVLAALGRPLMSPAMGGAYGNALTDALGDAQYRYGRSDAFADPNAYWLQQLYR